MVVETFKSPPFNPVPPWDKDFKGVKEQAQCIESGLPVFAKDIGSTAKKMYMACGYDYFCTHYYAKAKDSTRHMYELLQADKPTKIYIDFDSAAVNDKEAFKESTDAYIKAVLVELEKLSGKTDVPIYVLDATTDKKLSVHVIVECFLKDVQTVKAFVTHTLSISPCPYVDMGVYTSNRLFRLLYSYKGGRTVDSALRISGTSTDAPYNPHHVFKSLIQAMMPPHYDGPLAAIKNDVAHSDTFIQIKNGTDCHRHGYTGTGGCPDAPPGLGKFIEEFSDDGVLLSCRENDNFISCIVGNKRCPWKQKVHKNNNQYFIISKSNMRGFFQCADNECRRVQYGHVDVSCLWRDNLIASDI